MSEDDAILGKLLRAARDRLPSEWQLCLAITGGAIAVVLYDWACRPVRTCVLGEDGDDLGAIVLDAVNTARNAEGLNTINARGEIRVELN